MALVATIAFGATMILIGVALMAQQPEPSAIASWATITGLAAVAAAGLTALRPRAWRLTVYLVSAPALVCLAFAVATVSGTVLEPGRAAFDTHRSVFATAMICVIACWLSFVLVAMVQATRRAEP